MNVIMKLIILVFIAVLTSCTAQKISVYVEVHKPYCGGAKPTPEIAKGTRTPFSNQKVAIFKSASNKTTPPVFVKFIELDSLGKWIGKLKPGSYDFFRAEKTRSISEIEKKHRKPDNEMYAFVGGEKLKIWKETPDFKIEIKENSDLTITLSERCFVGLNPCMEYIGPKPK